MYGLVLGFRVAGLWREECGNSSHLQHKFLLVDSFSRLVRLVVHFCSR